MLEFSRAASQSREFHSQSQDIGRRGGCSVEYSLANVSEETTPGGAKNQPKGSSQMTNII